MERLLLGSFVGLRRFRALLRLLHLVLLFLSARIRIRGLILAASRCILTKWDRASVIRMRVPRLDAAPDDHGLNHPFDHIQIFPLLQSAPDSLRTSSET